MGISDFAVELGRSPEAAADKSEWAETKQDGEALRDVAVDDLGKAKVAVVSHDVETLGFDTGRVHGAPFQILLGEFGVGRGLCLLGDRVQGRGAVDGLRCASYVCCSV